MIITIRIFFITFEEDCVKASFDFFKMPGNTSDNLLRLKDMNEEEGMIIMLIMRVTCMVLMNFVTVYDLITLIFRLEVEP